MQITLVQPSQGTRFGLTKVLRVEPLGLECVSAALKAREHDTSLVDLRLDSYTALENHLKTDKPGAVGISCGFTSDVYTALETARHAKSHLPGTPVFAGGHHASLIPGDLLFEGSPIEAVIIGEGEHTVVDLVQALEAGDDPSGVPGVMTLDNLGAGFVSRSISDDLDGIPLPDRLLSARYRHLYHHGFRVPSACVETTRGCPFNCNFCSIWVFYERLTRKRSPDRIVEDLEQVHRLGEKNVMFTDDIAFLNRTTWEELAAGIKGAGLDLSYACETRADLVVKYRDLFQEWHEIGLHMIFLGIEKFDDVGLDSVRKRTKGGAKTNIEAIDFLRGVGISPLTSLIVDPAWEEEDFDRLEAFVKRLKLPSPAFSVLTPLPGTELWESRKHELTTHDYPYFDVMHLTLPSRLPPERFYERLARLFQLADPNTRLNWGALKKLARMTVRGHGFVMRRMFGAVRDMRSPSAYLANPGSITRPDWLPEDHGSRAWVERSGSPLVESMIAGVSPADSVSPVASVGT